MDHQEPSREFRLAVDATQARRAGCAGYRQLESNRRLEAVFAERDAEIATRLGEEDMGGYKFQCRYCGSRFSLEQQLEVHEAVCATPEERAAEAAAAEKGAETMTEAAAPRKPLTCRRCGALLPTLKDLSAHARTVHAAEHHAQVSASLKRYHRDIKKLDAAAGADTPGPEGARAEHAAGPSGAPAIPPAAHSAGRGKPPDLPAHSAACCPTCGGPLPILVANLVGALTRAGFAEPQAFEAAKIMRQVTGAAA